MKGRLLAAMAAVLAVTMALTPAVWAAEPGNRISNVLEATLTEETTDKPTVTIHDDLSKNSIVGLWDIFSVSTTPNGHEGKVVRAKITIEEGSSDGFTLEYLDSAQGTFKELSFTSNEAWYGPNTGFPLKKETSTFRVTWKKNGTYRAKISIMGGSNFAEELASTTADVTVHNADAAINLEWSADADATPGDQDDTIEYAYTVGQAFDVAAKAQLLHGMTHVDGVLYVIKVKKDGAPVGPSDLTVTGTDNQELGYHQDGYFYWGPRHGFTFGCPDESAESNCAPDGAETTFNVTVHQGGTYTVEAYAVQVPADEAWSSPGS